MENEIHRSVQPHGAASRPEADGGLQRHKGIPESHQEAGNGRNQAFGGLRRGAGEPERSKVLFQLANKTAGIENRDMATIEQLGTLALVENIIAKCIAEGIELQEPYKDIYQECKYKLERFHTVALIG